MNLTSEENVAYYNIIDVKEKKDDSSEQKSNAESTNKHVIVNDIYSIFNRLQEARPVVVDIRPKTEFAKSNIRESINIPLGCDQSQVAAAILPQLDGRWRWVKTFVFITDCNQIKSDANKVVLSFIIDVVDFINVYIFSQMPDETGGTSGMKKKIRLPLFYVLDTKYDEFYKKYKFLCKDSENKSESKTNNTNNDDNTATLEMDRLNYPNSIVQDRLYLGDGFHATMIHVMKDLGITHIVNCTQSVPCQFREDPDETENDNENENENENKNSKDKNTKVKSHGLEQDIIYCEIPISDTLGEQIGWYFNYAFDFISQALNENSQNKVLIHCVAGVSRSATITLAYLMKKNDWGLKDAFAHTVEQRSVIQPNYGFMDYLVAWEKKLEGIRNKNSGNNGNGYDSDEDSEYGLDLDLKECQSMQLYNFICDNIDENNKMMVIIDVRDKKSFEMTHIKGSVNVPIGTNFDETKIDSSKDSSDETQVTQATQVLQVSNDVKTEIRDAMMNLKFNSPHEKRTSRKSGATKSLSRFITTEIRNKKENESENKNDIENDEDEDEDDHDGNANKPRVVFVTHVEKPNLLKAMTGDLGWWVRIRC